MSDWPNSNDNSNLLRCKNASRNNKPSYVKRLNFGHSILELDVTNCFVTSNRNVVFDQNVVNIPCTEKKDYVRKWIETHENNCDSVENSSQLSPILGKSTTKTGRCSPILSSSWKKLRKKTFVDGHNTVSAAINNSSVAIQEQNLKHSTNNAMQCGLNDKSGQENKTEQEYLDKTPCTSPSIEKADHSPVLSKNLHYYKRRRRKLQYIPEDCVSSKRCKSYDNHIITKCMNSPMEYNNNLNTLRETIVNEDISKENLDDKVKETVPSFRIQEGLEKLSWMQQRLDSENSSYNDSNNDNPKIEMDTSYDSKDNECNKLSDVNSDSSNDSSNFIEEVDTQDISLSKDISTKSQLASELLVKNVSKPSQWIVNDSNETYCSEIEIMQNQSIHLSGKISQIPSLPSREAKSTQTAVISTITTPSKVSPDEIMYAQLLDSGKKQRKPKKGSIVAKLQSLIKMQLSGIRIWRHRMTKIQDSASAHYISVLVRNCTKRFGNQFLHGSIIEDRYNLLQSDMEETGQMESRDIQDPSERFLHRTITIILVCDIVGTLKTTSAIVINVYPPWNILDKIDLTLEAMYININYNYKVPDNVKMDDWCKHEKRIVKEFNCPCIEEGREVQSCARKHNSEKPDVMQQIFNF